MYGIWLWICLVAALVPAIALLIYVYRQDRIEKEPTPLLMKLLGFGVLSALIAAIIETVGEWILGIFVDSTLKVYWVLYAFLIVAASEEGFKYLFLKKNTWKHPAFNYRFDAVVYAIFVSLGFAAFENIFYVLDYGLGTAFLRAVISIPGHFGFAMIMGYFYGKAKEAEQNKDEKGCERNQLLAFLIPLILHGIFDALLMVESDYAGAVFVLFIVVFYIFVFILLRKESKNDHPILNEETLAAQAAAQPVQQAQPIQPVQTVQVEQPAQPVQQETVSDVQSQPTEGVVKPDNYDYNE